MLSSLHIENIAVIRRLDAELCPKMTVLTGETGAGKSVLIDSINMLLGGRTDRELIRSGEDAAYVSAVFTELGAADIEALSALGISVKGNEISLERTLSRDGRAGARIDGRAVTGAMLREVGHRLISVHGQNDTQKLMDRETQRSILDGFAENDALFGEYSEVYAEYTEIKSKISALLRGEREKNQLRDILSFQIKEISSHKLHPNEEEELLSEKRRLSSLERIRKHTDVARRGLCTNEKGITASYLASRAADALKKISDVVPEYEPLIPRLNQCVIELDDIAAEVAAISEEAYDIDPDIELDRIETRLDKITKLKRKYGSTVPEILEFCAEAKRRLSEIENSEELLSELEAELSSVTSRLSDIAARLTVSRRRAGDVIEERILESLEFLEMPRVSFKVDIAEGEFTPTGRDTVEFMISTNPGEPLSPMSKIVSGGELSRIMLALKCTIHEADGTPTLIFDEIDTGISGKTSRKVGIKLKEASRTAQVICVTHSAQIASLAELHLRISKAEVDGRNETRLDRLDREGRVEELARILGGISVTEAQRQAARDMLQYTDEE